MTHAIHRARSPACHALRACLQGLRGGGGPGHDADPSWAPELRREGAAHLRIAVPAIIAHTVIAPALPRFLLQHPEMRVQLLIADDPCNVGRCDAAVFTGPFELELQWFARCLTVVPDVLCASADFLAVHGTPRTPYDLSPEQCIGVLDRDSRPGAWSFRQGGSEVTVVPAAPIMFSDAQSAVASAVRGGGFVLVPEIAAESQIASGLLSRLLPDWHAPRRAVWLKHPGQLTAHLQTLADFLADLLPAAPRTRLA